MHGSAGDHIIAPSQDVLGTLTRIAHVPAQKIEVVHHGFDLEMLDPGNADSARVREELGLKGKLVFGAIGRLYALKNYPALVTAFASALGEVRDARLLIVGAGTAARLWPRQTSSESVTGSWYVVRAATSPMSSRRSMSSCIRQSPSRSGW